MSSFDSLNHAQYEIFGGIVNSVKKVIQRILARAMAMGSRIVRVQAPAFFNPGPAGVVVSPRTLWILAIFIALLGLQVSPVRAAENRRSDFLSQLLDEGIAFERAGNFKDALNRFNTMLVVDPNNAEAHYRIGLVFASKNDAQRALKYMKKAVELSPKNIRLSLNLAQQLERYERLDDAIAEYQRIIATGVRDPRIKDAEKGLALASSQSLVKKGEVNAALLVLNGLMLEYPEDPGVLFGVGGVYVLLNRLDEAERVMKKLEEKQPDNDLVHMNLGNLYERSGRISDAMREFKIIIDHKQSEQAAKLATFRYGILAGKENFRLGKLQEAMNSFDGLLKLDPKFTEALFNKALLNLQLKQFDEAERIFEQLIAANSNDFSARLNLATLHLSMSRLPKAVEQFEFVIKNDRDGRYRQQAQIRLSNIHNELGSMYFRNNELDKALEEYALAARSFGGYSQPWYNRGLILLQQRKSEEAAQEFIQAIGVEPTNMLAHAHLADIYESLNRFSDAANIYDAMMRISPESAEGKVAADRVGFTRAKGYLADKRYAEAQEEFEKLIAENPSNHDAWWYLGMVSDERGRTSEAADYMQKAIALRPGFPNTRLYLAALYNQLEMEELAEDEYRRVLFMGVNKEVEADILEKLNNVEAALSGFSRQLTVLGAYDSNTTMNDYFPSSDINNDISLNVIYANKFADDLRFNIQFSPTYSTFHKGNFDFYRYGLNYSMIKGGVDQSWNLSYSVDKTIDVDDSAETSVANSINVRNSRRIYLPAAFGLAPEGMEHDKLATNIEISAGGRDSNSLNSYMQLISPSFGISATQNLAGGVTTTASYYVGVNRTKVARVAFDDLNLNDGTTIPNVKVFDSKDYENDNHTIALSFRRWLGARLQGVLTASISYSNFINYDSTIVTERRKNLLGNLSFGFNYSAFKDIRLFGLLAWAKSHSNLPVRTVFNAQTTAESLQSPALGSYTKFNMTMGMQMTF